MRQIEDLKKQKVILQNACRRAAGEREELKDTIKALEKTVNQVLNPLRRDGLL
jgi:hypothetical protein|tara:strand:+ start:352 stop:510 length:159 start_codon:yes stop_codon:yes gene_type:complete